jgi:hypothetical protein
VGILKTIADYIGYIGAIAGAAAVLWKCFREQAKIREGQKCQLRTDMLRTYHKNKDTRKLRQYEAENFVMMYQAYKAMGGNSFIDEIYEHVTKWDVET